MRRLAIPAIALAALIISGIAATTALALPVVSVGLGGTFPLNLKATQSSAATKFSSPVKNLESKGLTLLLAGFEATPSTGCYKSEKDEVGGTGNYSDAECTKEVPPLKGEYVLAEPLARISEGLWCAKITTRAKTGVYEDNKCTNKEANGPFTEVIVPNGQRFELLLTNVHTGAQSCNSEGAASGEVLIKGAFDIVYTSLSPLLLGVLYLPSTLNVTCGTTKIKLKGSMLSSLKLGTSEAEEFTAVGSELTGNGLGEPTLSTYYNDAGEAEKSKLELDFGTGYRQAALEIGEEITTSALEGKMFVFEGR